jgi:hypothetical protein
MTAISELFYGYRILIWLDTIGSQEVCGGRLPGDQGYEAGVYGWDFASGRDQT